MIELFDTGTHQGGVEIDTVEEGTLSMLVRVRGSREVHMSKRVLSSSAQPRHRARNFAEDLEREVLDSYSTPSNYNLFNL
jgi:hypothetical protein